jgi:hypothetical protein
MRKCRLVQTGKGSLFKLTTQAPLTVNRVLVASCPLKLAGGRQPVVASHQPLKRAVFGVLGVGLGAVDDRVRIPKVIDIL